MKKILIALLALGLFVAPVGADDGAYSDDHSIVIDLGEGNGSLVIIGNYNTVYVPPATDDTCVSNHATMLEDGSTVVIMGPTELVANGIVSQWKQIVLGITSDGRAVVLSAEQ